MAAFLTNVLATATGERPTLMPPVDNPFDGVPEPIAQPTPKPRAPSPGLRRPDPEAPPPAPPQEESSPEPHRLVRRIEEERPQTPTAAGGKNPVESHAPVPAAPDPTRSPAVRAAAVDAAPDRSRPSAPAAPAAEPSTPPEAPMSSKHVHVTQVSEIHDTHLHVRRSERAAGTVRGESMPVPEEVTRETSAPWMPSPPAPRAVPAPPSARSPAARPPVRPVARESSEPPRLETTVRIGTVEIRAERPRAPAPPPTRPAGQAPMTLEAYLKSREPGGGAA